MVRLVQAIVAVLLFVSLTGAQEQVPVCCNLPIKYENHNQVDPEPLRLRKLAGRVVVGTNSGGEAWPACIGLFSEPAHEPVATAVAGLDGRFAFPDVRPGLYRLVVRDPQNALCAANAKIRVVRWPHGGVFTGRRLVVHLRAAGIDSCSYLDYR